MLKELYIENLAVIEKADIGFTDRFNVFSGETGAGKSILIGAINAVLGGRAHKELIRTGESKATVTALFDSIPDAVAAKLMENGYPADGELLIKRDISADGKGQVRINGIPATAALLKEITSGLIDIHGQQDNQAILNVGFHGDYLDSFAGLDEQLSAYADIYDRAVQLEKQL